MGSANWAGPMLNSGLHSLYASDVPAMRSSRRIPTPPSAFADTGAGSRRRTADGCRLLADY
jgi:hypothetical protein